MKVKFSYIVLLIIIAIGWVIVGIGNNRVGARADAYTMDMYNNSVGNFEKNGGKVKDYKTALERGLGFLKEGKTEMAVVEFQTSVKLNGEFAQSRKFLGYTYLKEIADCDETNWFGVKNEMSEDTKKANYKLAIASLKAAHRINPLDAETNQMLGKAYENSGDDKTAELWYARYKEVSKGF